MNDDLVKRLRNHIAVVIDNRGHVFEAETLCDEAADRIEELEAKLADAEVIIRIIASDKWDERLGEAVDLACEYLAELEDKQ